VGPVLGACANAPDVAASTIANTSFAILTICKELTGDRTVPAAAQRTLERLSRDRQRPLRHPPCRRRAAFRPCSRQAR
jgi:hypothetical protein